MTKQQNIHHAQFLSLSLREHISSYGDGWRGGRLQAALFRILQADLHNRWAIIDIDYGLLSVPPLILDAKKKLKTKEFHWTLWGGWNFVKQRFRNHSHMQMLGQDTLAAHFKMLDAILG